MAQTALLDVMQQHRLVAVVRSKTAKEALATARAVAEGGVKFVEITFTVPGAVDVIKALASESNVQVGAGTVLSKGQAEQGIGAGARFVVSPSLELNLIPLCHEAQVACIPGAASPTEIINAIRAKADLVKIFPADTLGGPHFVRQMLGPFPDARFMVSGGVSEDNVKEYAALGVVGIVLGSAYLAGIVSKEGHDGLVQRVGGFVQLVEDALKH